MRKHLTRGKEYDQHRKLELNPPKKNTRMKNDELEAPLVSSWESPEKNIDRKEWRDFPSIKAYLINKSESLKKKGGRAGKQRQLGDGWNKHRWENLELILRMLKMIGSTWREAHRLKRIDMTTSMIKRISTPIEIWEHHLEKVWNQHLTLKQLEYHNWKKTKDWLAE